MTCFRLSSLTSVHTNKREMRLKRDEFRFAALCPFLCFNCETARQGAAYIGSSAEAQAIICFSRNSRISEACLNVLYEYTYAEGSRSVAFIETEDESKSLTFVMSGQANALLGIQEKKI